MSDDSDRFRERATLCRHLAQAARDDVSRQTLIDMAADLEAEADVLDAEEPTKEAREG
jgi:hypothetical protein